MGGWEPAVTTTYEYDADGRVAASVTSVEPEWDRTQVAMLLASRRVESEVGPHGIPMSEAMDPANQWAYLVDDAPATDWAEKARRDAQDRYYKQYPDANRNGHIWSVMKRQAE